MSGPPTEKNILALIPARGGSKGIPGKNIVMLAGQPLIAYSIQQALQSAYVTRTIVSTDDEDIARVAREFGAEVPFYRPEEYSGDLSPDIEAFTHALEWLKDNENYAPDLVVHLRPTGPVRNMEIIDKAIETILADPNADSLRAVSKPFLTPYKMWRPADDGYIQPVIRAEGIHDSHSMPRQMLPEIFWQNGYIDIVRPNTILKLNSMAGEKVIPYVVDEPRLEIDYPEDIPVVEAALERMARGEFPTQQDDGITRHSV